MLKFILSFILVFPISSNMNEETEGTTPLVIFFLSSILCLCIMCKKLNKMTGVPYSSLILLMGIFLSLFSNFGTIGKSINLIQKFIGRDELYYIFIPILIFESGYNSNLFLFKRNIKPILLLAFPGVLFCTFLFAFALYFLGFGEHISFSGLLVISAILGSTDPIAVSSLLNELGTPHKLNIMLEGESLLNDGTSVVVFETFLTIYNGIPISIFEILLDTFTLCVGGCFVGYVFGHIFSYWIKKETGGITIVSITFINCFLVFYFCEYLRWKLSGILAVVLSSIILSSNLKINLIENELNEIINTIWHFAKFTTESILFVITGLFIGKEFLLAFNEKHLGNLFYELLMIIIFFFIMNICRLLVILLFQPFMNDKKNNHEYKISLKDCVLIAYSGIRGAFPLIIGLGIASNPHIDPDFRRTTMLIIIGVIFMGMIFGGLTLKFLVKNLNIKNQFEYNQNVKNLIEKDMFVENYKNFQKIKLKSSFNLVNWPLVFDLSGLKKKYKQIKSYKPKVGKVNQDRNVITKSFLLNENNIMAEMRIRVIYNLKALIYQYLTEAYFSSESARMLIEICDCSLEETDNNLSLWNHLNELLVSEDYFEKLLLIFKKIKFVNQKIKQNHIVKLCNFYESVNSFIIFLDIIKNSDEFRKGITSGFYNFVINEINSNIKQAQDFVEDMLKKNSVLLQLYQTKLATREILHNEKKLIKNLQGHGIGNEKDIKKILKINKENVVKVNNFGVRMDQLFIKEIVASNYLFYMLDDSDLKKLLITQKIESRGKDEIVIKKKQNSSGVYLILSGSVTEYFTPNYHQLKLIGNLIGITSIINKDFIYDTETICNTKCTFVKLDLNLIQECINKYQAFQDKLYIIFFHHKLNFLENLHGLEYDNVDENSLHYKNKGEKETIDHGFFFVKGEINYNFMTMINDKVENEVISVSDWCIEENINQRQIEISYEKDSVIIYFEHFDKGSVYSKRNEILRKSNFFSRERNLDKEFENIVLKELF